MEIRNQSEYVKERTTLRIEKGIHPNVSKRQQLFSRMFSKCNNHRFAHSSLEQKNDYCALL